MLQYIKKKERIYSMGGVLRSPCSWSMVNMVADSRAEKRCTSSGNYASAELQKDSSNPGSMGGGGKIPKIPQEAYMGGCRRVSKLPLTKAQSYGGV